MRMLGGFNLPDEGISGQQLFAGEATRLAYGTEEAEEGRNAFLGKKDPLTFKNLIGIIKKSYRKRLTLFFDKIDCFLTNISSILSKKYKSLSVDNKDLKLVTRY